MVREAQDQGARTLMHLASWRLPLRRLERFARRNRRGIAPPYLSYYQHILASILPDYWPIYMRCPCTTNRERRGAVVYGGAAQNCASLNSLLRMHLTRMYPGTLFAMLVCSMHTYDARVFRLPTPSAPSHVSSLLLCEARCAHSIVCMKSFVCMQ
jgi:hypothetical protein